MSKRSERSFQFAAQAIEEAASQEAAYHEARETFWREAQEEAATLVLESARVELTRHTVTGGERLGVTIKYGEPFAEMRMSEAFEKAERHRLAAERYRTDQRVYGSQGDRTYELDSDDVHHFRLGGQERDA